MKLNAEVQVINRTLPSVASKGKAGYGCIVLGRKNKEDGYAVLVQTATNKSGIKYSATKDNIEKVFTKFFKEGKCTIRFNDPPHDINLSKVKDINGLKSFLNALYLITKSPNNENINHLNNIGSLTAASTSEITKPKTKLIIESKKNFTSWNTELPKTLLVLRLRDLKLKRFDTRILSLKKLQILDMSYNELPSLPHRLNSKSIKWVTLNCDWSKFENLTELYFPNNKINFIPSGLCQSPNLIKTLKLVDFSDNNLSVLPNYFSNLKNLVTLKIKNNKINCLTQSLGKLLNLKYLDVSYNQLLFLPGSIVSLRLNTLDISNNPFYENIDSDGGIITALEFSRNPPSLLDLCGKLLLKRDVDLRNKLEIGEIPITLMSYLLSAQSCLCRQNKILGTPKFQAFIPLNLKHIAASYTLPSTISRVPIKSTFCSNLCLQTFLNNPFIS